MREFRKDQDNQRQSDVECQFRAGTEREDGRPHTEHGTRLRGFRVKSILLGNPCLHTVLNIVRYQTSLPSFEHFSFLHHHLLIFTVGPSEV